MQDRVKRRVLRIHLERRAITGLQALTNSSSTEDADTEPSQRKETKLKLALEYETSNQSKCVVVISTKHAENIPYFTTTIPANQWNTLFTFIKATGGVDGNLRRTPTSFPCKITLTDVPPAYDDVAIDLRLRPKENILEKGASWMREKMIPGSSSTTTPPAPKSRGHARSHSSASRMKDKLMPKITEARSVLSSVGDVVSAIKARRHSRHVSLDPSVKVPASTPTEALRRNGSSRIVLSEVEIDASPLTTPRSPFLRPYGRGQESAGGQEGLVPRISFTPATPLSMEPSLIRFVTPSNEDMKWQDG